MNSKVFLLFCLLAPALWAAAPPAPTTDRIGPMTITLPADWRREVAADGTLKFSPSGRTQDFVQFSSYDAPQMAGDAAHAAIFGAMLAQLTDTRRQQSGRFERFLWSEVEGFDASERARIWYRLYTTKQGSTHLITLVAAATEPLLRDRIAAVDAALSKAQFGTPAAVSGTPPVNSARVASSDVPIVEAHIHLDIRAITPTSNVLSDHILFFGNGIVVRSGFINGPRECYAALPVANLTALPFNYGRWREDRTTRVVDVAWQEGPPWHLTRDGDRLSLGGKKLLRFRSIDGAKLDGIYVYRPVGDPPVAFAFTPAGRFEAGNLKDSMVCPSGTPPIANGTGTYEIRKWTLLLRFENGALQLIPLKIADDETNLQQVSKFTIGSYEFARER